MLWMPHKMDGSMERTLALGGQATGCSIGSLYICHHSIPQYWLVPSAFCESGVANSTHTVSDSQHNVLTYTLPLPLIPPPLSCTDHPLPPSYPPPHLHRSPPPSSPLLPPSSLAPIIPSLLPPSYPPPHLHRSPLPSSPLHYTQSGTSHKVWPPQVPWPVHQTSPHHQPCLTRTTSRKYCFSIGLCLKHLAPRK